MPACHVSARFVVKPGLADTLRDEVLKIISVVRAEDGCKRYDFHRGVKNPDTFLFYEIWASPEALKKHGESPHMANFSKLSGEWLTERSIEVWQAVDVMP